MQPIELLAYVVEQSGIRNTAISLGVSTRHLRRLRNGTHRLTPAQFWALWQGYRKLRHYNVDVWAQIEMFEAYFTSHA